MKKIIRATNDTNFFVGLGTCCDFSSFEILSPKEQLEMELNPNLIYVRIESLNNAKELVLNFIKTYNLGGSNFIGGEVLDRNMHFVARISYNGRIWDNTDWKKSKEIIL
jgi:hypothetical protein